MRILGFTFLTKKEKANRRIVGIAIALILLFLVFFGYKFFSSYYFNSGEGSPKEENIINLLHSLLFEEQEQVYLILLQNNTELRPTGGFIGNYGILKIKEGRITSLYIDDIYNLDKLAEEKLEIIPPEPLRKYFNRERWFLRDINWSPDFSISAHRAWAMYLLEGGQEKIDGIIAVTLK
ncbi:MAG: DUF4012 domain-containing protein [Patescibacteria group bacterium]|jgi:hypothetical protein